MGDENFKNFTWGGVKLFISPTFPVNGKTNATLFLNIKKELGIDALGIQRVILGKCKRNKKSHLARCCY